MPVLTYTPEGADPIVWDFDFEKLMGVEVSAIEDATGLYFADFIQAFSAGSWKVRAAVAAVLMKRQYPSSKFEPMPSELDIDFNLNEARRYVAEFAADPDEDDRVVIAHLFDVFGDAIYRTEEPDSPKDPTPTE